MRVKSSGVAPVLANTRPPGSAQLANAPPPLPGLTRRANAAESRIGGGGGGGCAQLELTDALHVLVKSLSAFVL